MKRVTIITDTYMGANVNGVVMWLKNTETILKEKGFEVTIIHPGQFTNIPLPTYPEIRISLLTQNKMDTLLQHTNPDYIHIATEGSLGLVARMSCLKKRWQFTTFYHTRFPEYVYERLKINAFKGLTYSYLRWFHNAGALTMVSTESLRQELAQKKFERVVRVPLGVDIHLFQKNPHAKLPAKLHKPIFTYVGRIAPEKNIEAFLECDLPGTKLIIGDGPAREAFEIQYKKTTVFVGYKTGGDLIDLLSVSDVFVFPSKTDTFGLTIIEALACGLPVAAYPVQGPNDIITNGKDGFLGADLAESSKKCLTLDPRACRRKAEQYSWERSVETFIKNLAPIR